MKTKEDFILCVCPNCGVEFNKIRGLGLGRLKYCSAKCRNKINNTKYIRKNSIKRDIEHDRINSIDIAMSTEAGFSKLLEEFGL